MNILFISQKLNLNESGIYTDLINELQLREHNITIVRGNSEIKKNNYFIDKDISILDVKIKNQFQVGLIVKGFVILTFEYKFMRAIKKYLKNNKFELILYATPPIMFAKVVKYCKLKYNAKTYLMLKDIFPQNSIDLAILKKTGLRGIIYRYFRRKEIIMYEQSDMIGCMSQANIDYILKNNKNILQQKLELFPNAIYPSIINGKKKIKQNERYNNKEITHFIFGGNLGKPQNIKKLIYFIERISDYHKAHFTIIGKGTEQDKVIEAANKLDNLSFQSFLKREEYIELLKNADVGIISLDPKFTIPNYPSRILAYLELEKPILASTDYNTDIKDLLIKQAECGLWNHADDFDAFFNNVKWFCENKEERIEMGKRGRQFMLQHFSVEENAIKLEKFVSNK